MRCIRSLREGLLPARTAIAQLCFCLTLFSSSSGTALAATNTITINGTTIFQTIDGFGVNANPRMWTNNELQPVLGALVDQAGMTIFRLVHDNIDWENTNDNTNSNVMNWSYYNAVYSTLEFEKIWDTAAYFNQKGITNLLFNFQGQGPAWMVDSPNNLKTGYEDEWAEMITSFLYYARNTRHLKFNSVAPDNEPNLTSEGIAPASSTQYVLMLHKLAQKLDTNGLGDIRIVGPELSGGGTNWIPDMMSDSVVMGKVSRFGQHSYGSGSAGIYSLIKQSAYPSLGFWVTEFNVPCPTCEGNTGGFNYNSNNWTYCRGTAEYLITDLANGASSGLVWEGFDGYYPHSAGNWIFWGLFAINGTNVVPKIYTPRKNFYTVSQISRFVRPGAQRVGISGSPGLLELVAFQHPRTGQFVLTGANPDSNSTTLVCTLTNLPAITNLSFYYTSSSTNLYLSASFPLSNGLLTASIPADCVFTFTTSDPLYSPVTVQLSNPTNNSIFSLPATIPLAASASSLAGPITNVEFFGDSTDLGGATAPHYNFTWSNVSAGTHVLSGRASDAAGHSLVSSNICLTVVGPLARISMTPSNTVAIPWTTQSFTATGVDALGNTLSPQPQFAWSVTGGGYIDSSGLFSAGNLAGPILVQASNNGMVGNASITVCPDTNRAPGGTGMVWYTLNFNTDGSPQAAAPGMNDGDSSVDVRLLPGTAIETVNAFEAGGVTWSTPQTLRRILYQNGSYSSSQDGVFAAAFKLQFSEDGWSWYNAGPEWTVTPAYAYNSPSSGGATFTFTGGTVTTLGVRCCGQVHIANPTGSSNSWVAFARELQAFAGSGTTTSPPPVLGAWGSGNCVNVSWPGALTNYVLESSTSLTNSATWSTVTNSPWQLGLKQCMTVAPTNGLRFYRLRLQ